MRVIFALLFSFFSLFLVLVSLRSRSAAALVVSDVRRIFSDRCLHANQMRRLFVNFPVLVYSLPPSLPPLPPSPRPLDILYSLLERAKGTWINNQSYNIDEILHNAYFFSVYIPRLL